MGDSSARSIHMKKFTKKSSKIKSTLLGNKENIPKTKRLSQTFRIKLSPVHSSGEGKHSEIFFTGQLDPGGDSSARSIHMKKFKKYVLPLLYNEFQV